VIGAIVSGPILRHKVRG